MHKTKIDIMDDPLEDVLNAGEKRRATVYDAVAGRCNEHTPTSTNANNSHSKDKGRGEATAAAPPERVMRGARSRGYHRGNDRDDYSLYEDAYRVHRYLKDKTLLPDSDLLKAIHAYAADFYAEAIPNGRQVSTQSMDETALLALGILLEETADEVLGETGHRAFFEEVPIETATSLGDEAIVSNDNHDHVAESTAVEDSDGPRSLKRQKMR